MFTRICAIAVAIVFGLASIACETTPEEEPDEVDPVEEPAVEEEPTAEQERQMRRMGDQMHQQRTAMLDLYDEVDAAYDILEPAGQLEPELAELVVDMRSIQRQLQDHHRQMDGEEIEIIGKAQKDGEQVYAHDHPSVGEERGPGMEGERHQRMMQDRGMMEEMLQLHEEAVPLHEEMADLNEDVDRDELAAHHEQLAEYHEQALEHHEEMMEMMDEMGVSLAR